MVGGSAAERGLDFQARVSAIVMAHVVVERPMGWLEGVLDDTPLELEAETGGPGDDVRFLTSGGKRVELQAKRGLQRGEDLWGALLSLATGISMQLIDAGILAVCPNSSGTIREALSEDIVRLGTGRSDGLREIGSDFSARLAAASLDINFICSRIRITVVNAVDGNRVSESIANERLGRVVQDSQVAWGILVEYGRQLIRMRGKSTSAQIHQKLSRGGVLLKTTDIETRAQLQGAVRKWLHDTYAQISILGVNRRVSFDACWLSLDAQLLEEGPATHEELERALKQYHEYSYRHRTSEACFDSNTIGRFINKCVVLGGPGIGKSTLLKKLALEYSRDGFLTFLVKLPQVVAVVAREGHRFEDSVVDLALSGSGIVAPSISLDGAVLLCDGLDECGSQQPLMTAALHAFSIAHPNTRIVVASRPIGYRPGELADWRHYELQPLEIGQAEKAILQILQALPFSSEFLRSKAIELAKEQIQADNIKGAASRSPLMLTLLAALSAKGMDPGTGKAALYRQLFRLIEGHPPARMVGQPPSEPERNRFLELLGWSLLVSGIEPADRTLRRCAQWWEQEMGVSSLAAEVRVSACCDYWECLGVIERVRTQTQEAITFIHKTFGEFAAARYIFQCEGMSQRALIERAIRTPEWKETLSFVCHLGLASLILEVWAELVRKGESKAGHGLDDAMEMVVQSGIPVATDAIEDFIACCWSVVGNAASRSRYAAGEALCIVSKSPHWSIVRHGAFERLGDLDNWAKLVAWACLSVSDEKDIPFAELVSLLRGLDDIVPRESHRGDFCFSRGPTGRPVEQHLTLGAARRILLRGSDASGFEVLKNLVGRAHSMSVGTYRDLRALFKEFGLDFPLEFESKWAGGKEWLLDPDDVWNREISYLLETIDDLSPDEEGDAEDDFSRFWELGALLTASGYWAMPISAVMNMTSGSDMTPLRRMAMRGIAEAAGLERKGLVRQVRAHRSRILNGELNKRLAFADVPRVDVDVRFEAASITAENADELEQLILSGNEFFAKNAGALLSSLQAQPEYAGAVERLLAKGRGESLEVSVALANCLPEPVEQSLLLQRLDTGEITSGCRYLYAQLKPPFDARHVGVVLRGLDGSSVVAAKAAANLAANLPLTAELANQLRAHFVQWMKKEEPYPKSAGVVPDSPRDALAAVLAPFFVEDAEFLISLIKDERPGVRTATRQTLLKAIGKASQLRRRLVQETESGFIEPVHLRDALMAGLYSHEEAIELTSLLQCASASVRYAVLPILDAKYLPIEQVRAEGVRLLSDPSMDIREGACHALRKLSEVGASAQE